MEQNLRNEVAAYRDRIERGDSVLQKDIDHYAARWFEQGLHDPREQEACLVVDQQGRASEPGLYAPRWLCH